VRAAVSLLTLAFFAPVAAGCISNEYVIPNEELNRLVSTPPELRGQHVHIVQDLGSRRTDPVPTDNTNFAQAGGPWPPPGVTQEETPPEETRDTDVELDLRPGGGASFRWGNGESRHATVREVEPGERLSFEWDEEGEVEFTLADDDEGTRLTVVETSPAWSTALGLQAYALARV